MRTNRNLAKQFEKTYPQTNYYLQTLLINSSKYLKADEKRNAFTGQNNDEKYLSLVLSNIEKLIEYMYYEAVFSNISSKEDVLFVMNIIIDRYELIYPNWKNEYYFLRQFIFTEEVFYDAYSNTINKLLYAVSQKTSISKSNNKHSLDILIFNNNITNNQNEEYINQLFNPNLKKEEIQNGFMKNVVSFIGDAIYVCGLTAVWIAVFLGGIIFLAKIFFP